jgi:hypothetical protein
MGELYRQILPVASGIYCAARISFGAGWSNPTHPRRMSLARPPHALHLNFGSI